MLDELITEPLVLNLRDGNHEGVEAHFSQFANKVMLHCSEEGPLAEKYSALITLETHLELGAVEKSSIIQTIIDRIVRFLRKIRKSLTETWYPCIPFQSTEPEKSAVAVENYAGLESPEISITEGTEMVYYAKCNFFLNWPITKVIDKVNDFFGIKLTYQQVYNNWPNIQNRVGDDKALFSKRCKEKFELFIVQSSIATDKRYKTRKK